MEDPVRHANHRFRSRVGAWQLDSLLNYAQDLAVSWAEARLFDGFTGVMTLSRITAVSE